MLGSGRSDFQINTFHYIEADSPISLALFCPSFCADERWAITRCAFRRVFKRVRIKREIYVLIDPAPGALSLPLVYMCAELDT